MAYATPADLAAAPYNLSPANAEVLLDRASRDVDQALLCSLYDPADLVVVAALKAATLEQVAAGLANGDTAGLGVTRPAGFTLGKLSVSNTAPTGPGAPARIGRLWEQAWQVLQQAGLTGQGPQTGG